MGFGEWLGIAGLVVGIVSIPIGIWIGRRNRQRPDLRSAIDYDEVVAPSSWLLEGGLELNFEGQTIERVSRSFIAIWNHRGDTIRGDDEVSSDRLRMRLAERDSVLQVRVVAYSRPQIGVAVSRDPETPNQALIKFDFLDAGDGAVLEVLHHENAAPEILGTVRGVKMRPAVPADLSKDARARGRLDLRRRYWDSVKSRPTIYVAIDLFGLLIVVAGAVLAVRTVFRMFAPRLLPVVGSSLQTVEGQAEFARQVQLEGLTNGWDILPYLFGFLLVGVILVRDLRRRLARPIPKSVLAIDLDAGQGASGTA